MLRSVAVDDEVKALKRFERIIKQEENISLIGSFTKPYEAMEFIKNQEVDLVFLDIEMPKINGLELSEALFEVKPEIDVVFVTAYDKYALQAFQAHAIGYLLKPIDIDDIKKQVNNIIKRKQIRQQNKTLRKLEIDCFGEFLCFSQDSDSENLRFRTAKAEELFAFLIHCKGKPVSKEKIIDTLWPDMEVEKAATNLHATCYYIRDTLTAKGYADVFIRTRGCYEVKIERLKCDMLDFIQGVEDINNGKDQVEILENTVQLYKGVYFDDKPYEWTINMRLWFENQHEKLQLKLAETYRTLGEMEKARDILENIIFNNQLADDGYKGLIELSLIQGDTTSAMMVYRKYEKILKEELGISPSGTIKQMIGKFI